MCPTVYPLIIPIPSPSILASLGSVDAHVPCAVYPLMAGLLIRPFAFLYCTCAVCRSVATWRRFIVAPTGRAAHAPCAVLRPVVPWCRRTCDVCCLPGMAGYTGGIVGRVVRYVCVTVLMCAYCATSTGGRRGDLCIMYAHVLGMGCAAVYVAQGKRVPHISKRYFPGSTDGRGCAEPPSTKMRRISHNPSFKIKDLRSCVG